MKNLAHHMMWELAAQDFRGIQIDTCNDAVVHVWENPPFPFSGQIVNKINSWDYEEKSDDGQVTCPYRLA